MVNSSSSGRGCRFLLRLVDLIHDGVEADMPFDGFPIGISDGLPKNRRFCPGRCRASGCPGLEKGSPAASVLAAAGSGNDRRLPSLGVKEMPSYSCATDKGRVAHLGGARF